MKPFFAALCGLAALGAAGPAGATLLTIDFTGEVTSQQHSTATVGSVIGGSFTYDTVAKDYTQFAIDGYSVIGASSATPEPTAFVGATFAEFRELLSTIDGAPFNDNTTVELFGNYTGLTAATFLAQPETFTSGTVNYNRGNANGTNVTSITATLLSFTAPTPVPEPASLLLLALGALTAGAAARRRAVAMG